MSGVTTGRVLLSSWNFRSEDMLEKHPYGEFIPSHSYCMIIGSFPSGKFTNPQRRYEIKPQEFDFFFGGEKKSFIEVIK